MDRPDAELIRERSKVDFDSLGFTDDDQLQVVVDQANAYVEWVGGRALDSTMPANLATIAEQAVRMRTEQVAFQAQPDYIEAATDDAVSSFSAGNYSETRRDPPTKRTLLNEWVALNDLLWMLMTTDQFDYWTNLLTGVHAPAFEVTEVAWGGLVAGVSEDVPWLVEPRAARFPEAEIIDLDSWSW